jgi:hypothetical protein
MAHSTTRPVAIESNFDELVTAYQMSEPSKELDHLSRLARGARIASELSLESLGAAIERVQKLVNERGNENGY